MKFEEREPVIIENKGQKIFGVLHRPLGVNRAPAVLMCHGFAGNRIGKFRIYVLIAQQLAKAGIATLRIDFRGSGESEGDFSEMTLGGEVSDVIQGLQFLRSQTTLNTESIGLLGNSFGGAVAVLAAQQDREIKSLALLAPLFDSSLWRSKWELLKTLNEETSARELRRILDGNVPGKAFYEEFFRLNLEPALHDLQDTPLLHLHNARDERVGVDQTEHYRRCREHARAESKWVCLDQSDHDFSRLEDRITIISEVVKWFTKTLN